MGHVQVHCRRCKGNACSGIETNPGFSQVAATTTDNRILINYDGNGLYYNDDPTDTINQVYYLNNAGTISVLSGTYATPSSSQTHTFLGWSEDQNATTATYADEQAIIANSNYTHSDSPVTLYAVYQSASEVTVNFEGAGEKRMFASLAKLRKV